MTTTITLDPKLKKKIQARLKAEGLSFSAVARILLTEYANGVITIGAKPNLTVNGFTPEFEQEILDSEKDSDLSPKFKSAKEAIEYLHNEIKK